MARLIMLYVCAALAAACSRPPPPHHGGTGQGRPSPAVGGMLSGCFESDARAPYARRISLCLGPPSLPPGRYALRDSETVPDATFVKSCEGTYGMNGAAILLRSDRCSGYTINEQLPDGQPNPRPQAAPEMQAWARSPNAIGLSIRREPEIPLVRAR